MIKAIIIDDEKKSRDSLKALLSRYCPTVEVIAEADGYLSGQIIISNHYCDVVFLDVQMPDGSGFKLLQSLEVINFEVVFTTAFDKYAIQAIRFSALDYLLKPITPEELIQAVEKVELIKGKGTVNKKVEVLLESLRHPDKYPDRIVLHTAEKIQVVDIQSIIRCESDDYYTRFFFTDGNTLMVSKSLKEIEEQLEAHDFIRTHKSHLVNLQHVHGFDKSEGGFLVLTNGDHIPVSRRKREMIIEIIEHLDT